MSARLISALITVLLALLVAAACGDAEEASVTDTSTPLPSGSQTTTAGPTAPTTTPVDRLAYNDPSFAYSFEYPATWQITKEPAPGSIILYSYDFASIPPEDAGKPVPPDKLKVFFWIAKDVDQSLTDWLAEQDSSPGNPVPPTVLSQTDTSLDARAGLKRVTESDGQRIASYYVPTEDGNIFVVNALPADSELWPDFELVIASIRL